MLKTLEPRIKDGMSTEAVEIYKETAKLLSALFVQRIRDPECILECQDINNSRFKDEKRYLQTGIAFLTPLQGAQLWCDRQNCLLLRGRTFWLYQSRRLTGEWNLLDPTVKIQYSWYEDVNVLGERVGLLAYLLV